jgi:hypothetical protein
MKDGSGGPRRYDLNTMAGFAEVMETELPQRLARTDRVVWSVWAAINGLARQLASYGVDVAPITSRLDAAGPNGGHVLPGEAAASARQIGPATAVARSMQVDGTLLRRKVEYARQREKELGGIPFDGSGTSVQQEIGTMQELVFSQAGNMVPDLQEALGRWGTDDARWNSGVVRRFARDRRLTGQQLLTLVGAVPEAARALAEADVDPAVPPELVRVLGENNERTPAQVYEAWQKLSPDQQLLLALLHPRRVGTRQGVPAPSRDAANRVVLRGMRAEELRYLRSGTPLRRDLAQTGREQVRWGARERIRQLDLLLGNPDVHVLDPGSPVSPVTVVPAGRSLSADPDPALLKRLWDMADRSRELGERGAKLSDSAIDDYRRLLVQRGVDPEHAKKVADFLKWYGLGGVDHDKLLRALQVAEWGSVVVNEVTDTDENLHPLTQGPRNAVVQIVIGEGTSRSVELVCTRATGGVGATSACYVVSEFAKQAVVENANDLVHRIGDTPPELRHYIKDQEKIQVGVVPNYDPRAPRLPEPGFELEQPPPRR